VRLQLSVVQHVRDKNLMTNLVDFFKSGGIHENTGCVTYKASKLSDINEIIIPHFKKYPLQGYKFGDYEKFCSVALLMKNKEHLTPEGLNKILEIKNSK